MLNKKTQSGFTIIEIVLVLAIAGLIFLIVFLAIPQLQRNRRDTQRKEAASAIFSALDSYSSNNRGEYPPALGHSSFEPYIDQDNWIDPRTGDVYFMPNGEQLWDDVQGVWTGDWKRANNLDSGWVIYSRNAECVNSQSVTVSGSRRVALMMRLESGIVCLDNS